MSAFRCKADMTFCACLLLRSLLGVKRTWLVAAHMSASDPKRTSLPFQHCSLMRYQEQECLLLAPAQFWCRRRVFWLLILSTAPMGTLHCPNVQYLFSRAGMKIGSIRRQML